METVGNDNNYLSALNGNNIFLLTNSNNEVIIDYCRLNKLSVLYQVKISDFQIEELYGYEEKIKFMNDIKSLIDLNKFIVSEKDNKIELNLEMNNKKILILLNLKEKLPILNVIQEIFNQKFQAFNNELEIKKKDLSNIILKLKEKINIEQELRKKLEISENNSKKLLEEKLELINGNNTININYSKINSIEDFNTFYGASLPDNNITKLNLVSKDKGDDLIQDLTLLHFNNLEEIILYNNLGL